MIRAAAFLSLVVAFLLCFVAVGKFLDDHSRRAQAIENLGSAHTRNILDMANEARDVNQAESAIQQAESAERLDGAIGLAAVVFLIAALVMLAQDNKNSAQVQP